MSEEQGGSGSDLIFRIIVEGPDGRRADAASFDRDDLVELLAADDIANTSLAEFASWVGVAVSVAQEAAEDLIGERAFASELTETVRKANNEGGQS